MLQLTKPHQHLAKNMAIAFAWLIYILFLCELTMRVVSHFTLIYDIEMLHYAKELKIHSTMPGVSHQHRSNASAHLMGVDVTLNSLGHRSPELTPSKPANEKRIHFIGASVTFGWGVEEQDVFPSRVATRFNQEITPHTGYTYKAINAGIGNYNTYFDVELLKRQIDKTNPDVVVIQYYLNDAEIKPQAEDSFLLKYSEFAAFMHQRIKVFRATKNQSLTEYYAQLYLDDKPGWKQVQASLAELKQLCDQRRIPLVLFFFPEVHHMDENGPYTEIYNKVRGVAHKLGITTTDVTPLWNKEFQADPAQAWVAKDDPHPNSRAHRVISDVLFETLSKIRF